MSTTRKVLISIGLIGAVVATALGGYGTRETIRLVDFLRIFAGGFLLGVTLMVALRGRRADAPPPLPPPSVTPKSGA